MTLAFIKWHFGHRSVYMEMLTAITPTTWLIDGAESTRPTLPVPELKVPHGQAKDLPAREMTAVTR